MLSAQSLRLQLESSLAHRIASALTPAPHIVRAVEQVGIHAVDDMLQGGLPLGAITEIVGPECSGRTSLALAFTARMTQAGRVSAWVDVSSALHPESVAAMGVDLRRLLWVRCGERKRPAFSGKPWSRIEQALRVTDLLLQAGGFGVIVLDLGSIAPEFALRVPLATWFRYRKAAERSQASILLLTQHTCAKSSAGLVLRLQAGNALGDEPTVFTGMDYRVEILRERLSAKSNVIPIRKPPQPEHGARWRSESLWTGSR